MSATTQSNLTASSDAPAGPLGGAILAFGMALTAMTAWTSAKFTNCG